MKLYTITFSIGSAGETSRHTDRITGARHTVSEVGDLIVLDDRDRWRACYPAKCSPEIVGETEATDDL